MYRQHQNFYQILEVNINASIEEIKKSYRRLSKKHHPDKNQGYYESQEIFKKINSAFQVLNDENKRREYNDKLSFETVTAKMLEDPIYKNEILTFLKASGLTFKGISSIGGIFWLSEHFPIS